MKLRLGFVSNSSSASFVIKYEHLNKLQLYAIANHIQVARDVFKEDVGGLYSFCNNDAWTIIKADGDSLYGSTSMSNFNMKKFLELIGVNMDEVKWVEEG